MGDFRWIPATQWATLLERAEREGVTLSPAHPRAKKLMRATSGTKPGESYLVDEDACSCAAGQVGQACKHRALYLREHFARLVSEHGLPTEFVRFFAERSAEGA